MLLRKRIDAQRKPLQSEIADDSISESGDEMIGPCVLAQSESPRIEHQPVLLPVDSYDRRQNRDRAVFERAGTDRRLECVVENVVARPHFVDAFECLHERRRRC